MPAKQEYSKISRNRGRWVIKFIKDLSKTQSTALRERVVKVVNENGTKHVRKTTYASKTPEVTLRDSWDHKNSDVSRMPRETESKLQTWNFDPIPSKSRNWPDEDLQGQTVHAKT